MRRMQGPVPLGSHLPRIRSHVRPVRGDAAGRDAEAKMALRPDAIAEDRPAGASCRTPQRRRAASLNAL